MNKSIRVFSQKLCTLGEAPLWHPVRKSLFWLDILEQKLYEKKFGSANECADNVWSLNEIGSALALDGDCDESLFMVTDKSFGKLCLSSNQYTPITALSLASNMRANDGAVAPDGHFWFGTMEKSPTGLNGGIYSISPHGKLTKQINNIGIPNTFCWSSEQAAFFLSDSYQQRMFAMNWPVENSNTSSKHESFVDLTSGNATPDGGAMDTQGNLWNAQWDGHRVAVYSSDGQFMDEIKLPVPKITSCCFGGENNDYLFVTTARDGMVEDELKLYPLSGSTFIVKCPAFGSEIPPFYLKGII